MSPRKNNKRKHNARSSAPPSYSTEKVKLPASTLAGLKLPATIPEESGSQTYLESVQKFLDGKFPPMKAVNHVNSDKTRPPAFFDMHLHKNLRLEKIVFLRHLPKVLSEVCDDLLKNISDDDPREAPSLIFPDQERKVKNEETLAMEYNAYVAPHQAVASQLLFNTPGADDVLLLKVKSKDQRQTAIADSFLYLNPPCDGSLSKEHQGNIDLLEKYQLQNILVYEFKSLLCGPDVVEALKTFGGDFTWCTCQERSFEDEPSPRCSNKIHRINGRPMATGRKTGPDSAMVKDIIAECILRDSRDHDEQAQHISDSGSNWEEDTSTTGKKRTKTSEDSAASNADTQKQESEEEEGRKIRDAKWLLHQIWTESVAEDITFMIVSCGRQECIAIRSRESRTLYISEPVTTHTATSPSHAKLLVSTFIHSYNDACARVREMERCLNPIHNPAAQVEAQRHYADWLPLYNLHIDKENKPATKAPKPKAKKLVLHEESQESRDKKILEKLKESNTISLRLHETILLVNSDKPNAWSLTRTEPSTSIGGQSGDSNNFLFLDVEDKITERVYESYLCLSDRISHCSMYYSKPVYIKLGRKVSESKKLLTEYDMYKLLNGTEGNPVPENLGLFSYQPIASDGTNWYFLLLDNAGISFHDRFGRKTPKESKNRSRHIRVHEKVYLRTVQHLHNSNVSHNDIDAQHIMLQVDSKKAGLISLSNCDVLTEASKTEDIRRLEGLFTTQ